MNSLMKPLFYIRAKLLAIVDKLNKHRYDKEELKDRNTSIKQWGMNIGDLYSYWFLLILNKLNSSFTLVERMNYLLQEEKNKPKNYSTLKIVIITLILGILLFLTGNEWKITSILSNFEPFNYSEFISEYYSADGIIAYLFWICAATLLGEILISIIRDYYIGWEYKRFFSVQGFLFWVMVLYIFEISSYIFEPFVLWCVSGHLSQYPLIRMIFLFIIVFLLIFAFTQCVDDLLPIYFGVPSFYLFTALHIQYLVGLVCMVLVPIVGADAAWGSLGYGIYCFALSYFTRLLIDFLHWIGIIPLFQSIIRFVMFRIPYMLIGVPIVYILLFFLRVIL